MPSQLLESTSHRDTIIIAKTSIPSAWRELGGDRRDDPLKVSDVIVNPANSAHATCWDGEVSFTIFSFDAGFIHHAAYEYIYPGSAKLLPHFAQSDPLIYWIVDALTAEIQSPQFGQIYIDQLTLTLTLHLLKKYCSTVYQFAENSYLLSNAQKQQIIDYVKANIDRKVGLVELANLLNMSRYHFTRLFKGSMGICPSQYLIEQRLKKAVHLLENTKLGIGAIAQQTGFSSQSHFSSVFSKKMQVSPAKYRNTLLL
jgi:AraC family transcriptional regulator